MLSITTDYFRKSACPEPYLRRIAEAGFSHLHWCHQWNTDFVYAEPEIVEIAGWLREFDLKLLDLHASHGVEKAWGSLLEYERLAGVELVTNRIVMTARLGGDVIIMHLPDGAHVSEPESPVWDQLWKSLDELEPVARSEGVRVAIENGSFEDIAFVLARYESDYVGLCYDSGHANCRADGIERLDEMKDRLISLHLHDNDGQSDEHKIPLTGTVDWDRLMRVIGASSYTSCVSLEVAMRNTGIEDEEEFLRQSYDAATRLQAMLDAAR